MPNVPCPQAINCPSSDGLNDDWPIQNWTSEQPDQEIFIGLNWGWDFTPRLGTNWTHSTCFGVCTSTISQDDADQCAARESALCTVQDSTGDPTSGDGGGGTPTFATKPTTNGAPKVYYSDAQTCEAPCPDGTVNRYTTPAGTFIASSPGQANAAALSYCSQNVRRICLSDLSFDWACVDQGYTEGTISITLGSHSPYQFSVSGGQLPPGMNLIEDSDTSCIIAGNPTTPGVYPFTVKALDAQGHDKEKQYTISIFGIDNCASLPQGTCDKLYLGFTFTTKGGNGNVTFKPDPLYPPPAGLTLGTDGSLTGTPTGYPESRLMKIVISDSSVDDNNKPDPRVCTCECTITINGPKFLDSIIPNGQECQAYNGDIVHGFKFSVLPIGCTFSGSVPPGLQLASDGTVTGYPTAAGPQQFSLTANDGAGHTNNKSWNVIIANTGINDPNGNSKAMSVVDMVYAASSYIEDGGSVSGTFAGVGGSATIKGAFQGSGGVWDNYGNWNSYLYHCSAKPDYQVQVKVDWTFTQETSIYNGSDKSFAGINVNLLFGSTPFSVKYDTHVITSGSTGWVTVTNPISSGGCQVNIFGRVDGGNPSTSGMVLTVTIQPATQP